jgi:MtN3 and saliva related transmembrane protein
MQVSSIFGVIALVTSFIGLLPQAYKAFRTRSTRDISMVMLLNYLLCSVAWIIYGNAVHAGFVVASNIIGFITAILLIAQKLYYDKRSLRL